MAAHTMVNCNCNRIMIRTPVCLRRPKTNLGIREQHTVRKSVRRHVSVGAFAVADQESPLSAAESDKSSPAAIRKYLTSIGWQSAWIDGIVEKLMRKQLITTSDNCQAVVEYLVSVGLSESEVCNMVSLCMEILSTSTLVLKPVVAHMEKKGVKDIPGVLRMHPRLLTYSVSEDGSLLEKGKMRAAVVAFSPGDLDSVRIATYREGTVFNTAPVTPWKPSDL